MELDALFRALADPGRRTIVERLSRGPASVSELAKPLDMSLSAVVQHLQVLEDIGLISSRKNGRVRTCELEAQALEPVATWVSERKRLWESRLDRLGEYLNARAAATKTKTRAKAKPQRKKKP